MEFHVSRTARDRYHFDLSIYNLRGNVIFANFYAARAFADRMNQTRDLVRFPEQAIKPGKINALGLVDEIIHAIFQQYVQEVNPSALAGALSWLETNVGQENLDQTLIQFITEFPPLAVYQATESAEEYLIGSSDGISHRESTLEELIALWLANRNPAFSPFIELFDDSSLQSNTAYREITEGMQVFFRDEPAFTNGGLNLLDLLEEPARKFPHSLEGQLSYLLEAWGHLLGDYVIRILTSLDLIQEEQKAVFFGPGPSPIPDFIGLETEPERFSPDRDWMPEVVLLAKNAFVWLSQLSKKYGRPITHLNHVPDEELEMLRDWGVTGLWLIGLWERSPASKRIKNIMGNAEAEASAYSIRAYDISSDLGGDESYQDLRNRASGHGIRLASDMVPNHMGLDSPWVIEHPDWFISLDHSPFPAYSFHGHDLSSNPGVGLFIEDHYYNHTDAAVVFRRLDRASDQNRYIYHGNDGTSMPWNDTAQINFLNPAAREAVIQTILHVARKFSIIRFDAAMTLAKRHYQRLWFPEPGTGGAIPSRAGHGMTKSEFNQQMPLEFWREVVDRVAEEVPDTLLLAEAFWLMEGYFVRTLGMHRVYNSAFMNMLRDEENANYRSVMKNTLQFDPDILKRFVNFMNNPDERTAVDQFGKGDKYFGILLLMATLPGLPMLGHGQVEGFSEKYGMEFRKPSWEEESDPHLISRHEREIFPLFHQRRLFAGVDNFLLYDYINPDGTVNEDVFAYSNGTGNQRTLIVYNNRYSEARGRIHRSVAYAEKSGSGTEKSLKQSTLGEGLALRGDPKDFCILKDHSSGLEYLYPSVRIVAEGLEIPLSAYKALAFTEIMEVSDISGHYAQLDHLLGGRGVPSVEEARRELLLQPVHQPLKAVISAELFEKILEQTELESHPPTGQKEWQFVVDRVDKLAKGVRSYTGSSNTSNQYEKLTLEYLENFAVLEDRNSIIRSIAQEKYDIEDRSPFSIKDKFMALNWIFIQPLGTIIADQNTAEISRAWMDEWKIGKLVSDADARFNLDAWETSERLMLLKSLVSLQDWDDITGSSDSPARRLFMAIMENPDSAISIGTNRYQDVLWINAEKLATFLDWLIVINGLKTDQNLNQPSTLDDLLKIQAEILTAAEEAGYQVEKMFLILDDDPALRLESSE